MHALPWKKQQPHFAFTRHSTQQTRYIGAGLMSAMLAQSKANVIGQSNVTS